MSGKECIRGGIFTPCVVSLSQAKSYYWYLSYNLVKTLRMMPNLHQLRLQNNLLQHVYDVRDYIISSPLSMLIEKNPLHCMGSLCWLQEVETASCNKQQEKCMLKQEVQRNGIKKKVCVWFSLISQKRKINECNSI